MERPIPTASKPGSAPKANHFHPGDGGKFIAKVLERGGCSGIIESLRDGPAKVQQAYLNIINIIFCPNLFERCTGLSASSGRLISASEGALSYTGSNTADGMALKPCRLYFLKSAALLSALQRLVEQGSSSATRAKALLACQFLCIQHPAILAQLAERRLTYVLMRTLEPVLTFQGVLDGTGGATGPDANNDSTLSSGAPAAISYSVKVSLSMMLHIKTLAGRVGQLVVCYFVRLTLVLISKLRRPHCETNAPTVEPTGSFTRLQDWRWNTN
jgi:hypothetical protein